MVRDRDRGRALGGPALHHHVTSSAPNLGESVLLRGAADFAAGEDAQPMISVSCRVNERTPCVLTYFHPEHMVSHMKTTLNIDASVMAVLKREAARRGCTMSELVESALCLLLRPQQGPRELSPLPSFRGGGHLVDIADRDALYQAMEGR